jgi:beta-glucosidase/6-phospho-beta-glucosidase/beta-galactosidase
MSARPRVLATLEGYRVEGGLDVVGGPATCYTPTIALGRHAGPGESEGLWADYESVLDEAVALGLDGVVLGWEWARIEPRPGEFDEAALARYRRVVDHAHDLALSVSVVLVTSTWPAWAGAEAWLLPWVAPRFLEYADRALDALAGSDARVRAFDDGPGLVAAGFLEGTAPPWRRRARADARSALAQVAALERAVGARAPWRDTGRVATARVEDPPSLAAALAAGAEEVHLRSLVRGRGPSARGRALLARDAQGWRRVADDALLAALLR